MGSSIRFTKHALQRISERIRLSSQEVAEIIASGKYVPIGEEKGKIHKVFFSVPDGQIFVAIQDKDNDEIVTVIPPDYHHRWEISTEVFFDARRLVMGIEVAPAVVVRSRIIKFFCYYGGKIIVFKLNLSNSSIDKILQTMNDLENVNRFNYIRALAIMSGLPDLDNKDLKSVYYRVGRKGTPKEYPFF